MVEKTPKKLKFQMGITGVPFGRTELLVPPLESQERDLARGKFQGAWGLGRWENFEKCSIVLTYCLSGLKK